MRTEYGRMSRIPANPNRRWINLVSPKRSLRIPKARWSNWIAGAQKQRIQLPPWFDFEPSEYTPDQLVALADSIERIPIMREWADQAVVNWEAAQCLRRMARDGGATAKPL